MVESARADLKQRGIKDADTAPIPPEMFKAQAERRVRLGLVVAELVRAQQPAGASPDQLQRAHRGAQPELREARRSGALLPERPPAHGRGRGHRHREQRAPSSVLGAPVDEVAVRQAWVPFD
jgi:hypothetical protein